MSYYWSTEPGEDQPPFPITLFVVDTEEVEATYVRTASLMNRMSPCPSSCPVGQFCLQQGYWGGPGIHSGNRSPRDWHCPSYAPTNGIHSTTGWRHRPVGGIDRADAPYPPPFCCLGAAELPRRGAFRGSPVPQPAPFALF